MKIVNAAAVSAVTLLALTPVLGQDLVQSVSDAGGGEYTFKQMFEFGGHLMYVLVAVSVFAVADVIYLLFLLRRGVTVPRALERDVMDKLRSGLLEDARKACDYRPSPFSAIVITAVEHVSRVPGTTVELLINAVQGEGARQAGKIESSTQWLLDVATISPMIGLLGTVIGMLKAFSAVGTGIVAAKPVILAAGVSQALVTTIAGLVIAIPAMAFYAWFRRRAARQVACLESVSSEVVSAIIQRD